MANPRTEYIFDTIFWFALGVAGLIIALLWFATDHSSTKTNLNILWALPTHLLYFWRRNRSEWVENYFTGAALLAALTLLFWAFIPQEMPVAAIPIAALVVVKGMWRRHWKKGHEEIHDFAANQTN
jgi:amino acid transporter